MFTFSKINILKSKMFYYLHNSVVHVQLSEVYGIKKGRQ